MTETVEVRFIQKEPGTTFFFFSQFCKFFYLGFRIIFTGWVKAFTLESTLWSISTVVPLDDTPVILPPGFSNLFTGFAPHQHSMHLCPQPCADVVAIQSHRCCLNLVHGCKPYLISFHLKENSIQSCPCLLRRHLESLVDFASDVVLTNSKTPTFTLVPSKLY